MKEHVPQFIITTVAGTGVEGYSGDAGPAENAEMSNPDILAFDRMSSALYVPDYANAAVRKLTRIDCR